MSIFFHLFLINVCLVTLCNPTDCGPAGSSVHRDSLSKNTGVGCHALLQGIIPTQGSNPDLPHCKWILYCLSHQGSLVFDKYLGVELLDNMIDNLIS